MTTRMGGWVIAVRIQENPNYCSQTPSEGKGPGSSVDRRPPVVPVAPGPQPPQPCCPPQPYCAHLRPPNATCRAKNLRSLSLDGRCSVQVEANVVGEARPYWRELPGEDLTTSALPEVAGWIAVYEEMASVLRSVISRVGTRLASQASGTAIHQPAAVDPGVAELAPRRRAGSELCHATSQSAPRRRHRRGDHGGSQPWVRDGRGVREVGR